MGGGLGMNSKRVAKSAVSWLLTLGLLAAGIFLVKWSELKINTVATSSMVPTYNPTDMVISISPKLKVPGVGDAIVFETEFAGQHIPGHVHRINAANSDGSWETQGDANPVPDPWRVQPSGISGVVIWSVPGAIFRSPLLIGGLLFLVAAYSFWPRKKDEHEPTENTELEGADSGIDPPMAESLEPQPVSAGGAGESDAGIEILSNPDK